MAYHHSVRLEPSKCIGCTDCIKRCPTEAIRVRGSKAQIIEERCIDCGNCIRICRNGAKQAVTDELSLIKQYQCAIALPAPSFYAQFPKAASIKQILSALIEIGFTDVFEVAAAAEVITLKTKNYLKITQQKPVISSACPAIVGLIQRRFPNLIPNILPMISPMELSARYVKHDYEKRGYDKDKIGTFFISPCPAKATEVRHPKGILRSEIDGILSMQSVYKKALAYVKNPSCLVNGVQRQSSLRGLAWAMPSGSLEWEEQEGCIAVDGIENVIQIFNKIEEGALSNVRYIEALACPGGCLGGALNIENAYISRNTLKNWMKQDELRKSQINHTLEEKLLCERCGYDAEIMPNPVFSLDKDFKKAIAKMEEIENLYKRLPQIDCGSCGAPTCRSFAEDVVKKQANEEECIFILRKKMKDLSEAMHALTQTVIPTDNKKLGGGVENDST